MGFSFNGLSEQMDKQKILAKVMIEVAGTPQEHIDQTVKLLAEQIAKEAGVKVVKQKIGETIVVKIDKITRDMFSSFVELEMWFDNLESMSQLMFMYYPSHVEIIEPHSLTIPSDEVSEMYTTLAAKLHHLDSFVKKLKAQVAMLATELKKFKE